MVQGGRRQAGRERMGRMTVRYVIEREGTTPVKAWGRERDGEGKRGKEGHRESSPVMTAVARQRLRE